MTFLLDFFSFISFICAFCFRPDGQKKAYVRLAQDYDALDVANKVCIHTFSLEMKS